MEALLNFIEEWGYVAVFLGALIEGESVILLASGLAWLGYFSIIKIMIVAFCGTAMADQVLFQVGHHFGASALQRFPRFQKHADHAFSLLKRWGTLCILTFRFIYGVRIIGSVVIGASGYDPKRFVPLNLLSALIWTVISCMGGYILGYFFGELVQDFILEHFKVIEKYFICTASGLIFFGITLFCLIHHFKKKRLKTD